MPESKPFGIGKLYAASFVGSLFTIIVLGSVVLYQSHVDGDRKKLYPKGGGNTSSPIKVRGGAMTARTSAKNGWGGGGSVPFCSNANDVSYIYVDDNEYGPFVPGWTLTIYGRLPAMRKASPRGIVLTSQLGGCPADTSAADFSIALSLTGNNTAFSNPKLITDDSSDAVRFIDTTPECIGPDGYKLNPSGQPVQATGDEDVCEHAIKITFTPSPQQTNPAPPPPPGSCPNGECVIGIGRQ